MWIGDLVAEGFLLEQEVAAGGGGRIFRARDAVDSRQVAVKAILHLDHDAVVRFKRESLLLARISHPGLLRYLAHGVSADGAPWLATEWLEGEDLRRHLSRRGALVAGAAAPGVPPDFFSQRGGSPTIVSRRGREDPPLPPAKTNAGPGVALLPTEAVLTLLRRLAAALATLHAEGIVHRDIKPSNIFLVDGLVSQSKLIDLGLARNLLNPGDVTRTGLLVGTPRYMAPEQARCDAHVTAAADVWAVGCVAYECLSGQSPFDGDDLADMFARILHDEPAALTGRGLDAPELLLGLVHRMLSKDPAERPRDGAALVDELEIILASERMAGRAVAVRSPDGTYDGMHAAEEEGLVPASGSSLRDLERRVGCSLFAAAGYDADDVARFEAAVAAASLRASSCWSVPPSPSAPAHRASSAWVVRLPVSGTTVDLAHRAVRLALQLARELPGWSFALTTGFFPVVSGGDSDAGDEAALCDHLTRAAVCFPGTRLRVRYSVDGVPSSA